MQWNSKDICEALALPPSATWMAERVTIDSRRVQAGDLFVALRGENFDGHDFIGSAVEKGAVAVIAEKNLPCSVPLLQVENSLSALQQLARLARRTIGDRAKVIAVTGSVGKTTTKEMLVFALSQLGKCYGAGGNFNNHIGLPLTLLNCPEGQDFIVLEMGMNHAGEISLLTEIGQPDIAIVTNVKPAHMMNFADLQGVADAKSEIFESAPKHALFIGDDADITPYLHGKARQAGIADIRTFGEGGAGDGCHYRLLSAELQGDKTAISADFRGQIVSYSLGMPGRHGALNSLVVMAVVDIVGLSHEGDLLADFTAPKGRGALSQVAVSGGTAWLIDESYNASPAAVEAALRLLAELKCGQGRTVAILGDMLELGDNEESYHKNLAEAVTRYDIDKVVAVGRLMGKLYESLPESKQLAVYDNCQDFLQEIYDNLQKDDIILLKASNSMGFGEAVEKLQRG